MSGRLENDSFKLSELKLNLGNMADNWFASYTEYQTHYAKSQRKNSVNGIVRCSKHVRIDQGFAVLLYGSGHQSCLPSLRRGRLIVMKYVTNRCRR